MKTPSDRAMEIAKGLRNLYRGGEDWDAVKEARFLDSLPEFAESKADKWIKCSERMPEVGMQIYWWDKECSTPVADDISDSDADPRNPLLEPCDYWMPRHVPAQLAEEESELIKELLALRDKEDGSCHYFQARGIEKAIEIVKRHPRPPRAGYGRGRSLKS